MHRGLARGEFLRAGSSWFASIPVDCSEYQVAREGLDTCDARRKRSNQDVITM